MEKPIDRSFLISSESINLLTINTIKAQKIESTITENKFFIVIKLLTDKKILFSKVQKNKTLDLF